MKPTSRDTFNGTINNRDKFKYLVDRFHMITFFIILSVAFAIAIIHINVSLSEVAKNDTYTPSTSVDSIDDSTLDNLSDLQTSDEVTTLDIKDSSTRTNPFSE